MIWLCATASASQEAGLALSQGTTEAAVHTLQTGWCFYSGLEAAKRSNVWLASQSPAALAMASAAGQLPGMPSPQLPQRLPTSPSGPESPLQVALSLHAPLYRDLIMTCLDLVGRGLIPAGTAS